MFILYFTWDKVWTRDNRWQSSTLAPKNAKIKLSILKGILFRSLIKRSSLILETAVKIPEAENEGWGGMIIG